MICYILRGVFNAAALRTAFFAQAHLSDSGSMKSGSANRFCHQPNSRFLISGAQD